MSDWHYVEDGATKGPVEEGDLKGRIETGQLPLSTLVWREGMADWQEARAVPELAPAGQPPPVPPPLPPAPAAPPQTSGKAIGALISSVVGLTMCLFIGQIIGIVLGHSAKREIARSEGRLTGDGLATAGIVVGWIGLLIDVILVVIWGWFVVAAGSGF